ncbi:MAG TPA: HD domain-containing protein [Gemmatimonadales bacterium]|nr:HD domain-containing protein [Gemmatimonadales bacterium]HYT81982.1 HD domain-containing protein [Gemmatimonadales bacterium]
MSLPSWAVVTPERRGHIERVASLLSAWAVAMDVPDSERARWLKAAWLHDALRDAPAASELEHGPFAAERAARDGERDQGVLEAVRYHSLGYAGWDDVGKMLYLADYLEPGRKFDRELRRELATRVPGERDRVLREVAERRIGRVLPSGWPLARETVDFWNALVSR